MNNCRMPERLVSSGKVKTQQDSKSCCFHNSVPGGDGGKDTPAVWTPDLPVVRYRSQAAWIEHLSLKNPSLLAGVYTSGPSTAPYQSDTCKKLMFSSVVSGCHFWVPHWLVSLLAVPLPNLFQYFFFFPSLLNVVKFKVNIVLLSLTLGSR